MIQRAHNEPLFTWIFLNYSRESFNRGYWVDFRKDEDNEIALFSNIGDMELLKKGIYLLVHLQVYVVLLYIIK